MKYFLVIFIFIISNNSFAYQIQCSFEEVYPNGEIQNGLMYYQNKKRLRYQYNNQNLYTLIYKNDTLFIIQNNNPKIYEILKEESLIKDLILIMNDYPSFQNSYLFKDKEIKFEKNESSQFIKRLVIKSLKLNMSIYFNDCKEKDISNQLFNVTTFQRN